MSSLVTDNNKQKKTNTISIFGITKDDHPFDKDKCKKIIKLLHAMHTALDDITLKVRGSVTEQQGAVLFSMHNDLNLFDYLKYKTKDKPTNQNDVYDLLFDGDKNGLTGLIYDENKIKIAQIIHPDTDTTDIATRAQGKAYQQWREWQKENKVKNMPKNLRDFLDESDFTKEPNSWLKNNNTFSLDNIPVHVQVFGTVAISQSAKGNKQSFNLTMAEKEYILVKDIDNYKTKLPKKAVLGHLRDFLLIPNDSKINQIIQEDFDQNNIYSSSGGFLYEYNEEIDDNRFASWKEIYQMYIRDNYKKYGSHNEQEEKQTGLNSEIFSTTPYNKDGLICAVCWRNIKMKKKGKKKKNKNPILQNWLNQEYDVDHVFNLIMNNLLELNYSGIGFLNTCGPCNRTFKGEKLWSPSWELWNSLLKKADLDIDKYPWPGAKSQGFLEKKPPGGYTKFCLEGYRNPDNENEVRAYCEEINNGTSFNPESIKLGEGINSKSALDSDIIKANNVTGGTYNDIEEIILNRLSTLIDENTATTKNPTSIKYYKIYEKKDKENYEKSIIRRKDLLDKIFNITESNELKQPIVQKYLDSVSKYLAANVKMEQVLGDAVPEKGSTTPGTPPPTPPGTLNYSKTPPPSNNGSGSKTPPPSNNGSGYWNDDIGLDETQQQMLSLFTAINKQIDTLDNFIKMDNKYVKPSDDEIKKANELIKNLNNTKSLIEQDDNFDYTNWNNEIVIIIKNINSLTKPKLKKNIERNQKKAENFQREQTQKAIADQGMMYDDIKKEMNKGRDTRGKSEERDVTLESRSLDFVPKSRRNLIEWLNSQFKILTIYQDEKTNPAKARERWNRDNSKNIKKIITENYNLYASLQALDHYTNVKKESDRAKEENRNIIKDKTGTYTKEEKDAAKFAFNIYIKKSFTVDWMMTQLREIVEKKKNMMKRKKEEKEKSNREKNDAEMMSWYSNTGSSSKRGGKTKKNKRRKKRTRNKRKKKRTKKKIRRKKRTRNKRN